MQVIHAIGRNFDKEFVWPRPRSTTRVWWSDKRGILIDLNDVPLFHKFLQASLMVSSRFLRFFLVFESLNFFRVISILWLHCFLWISHSCKDSWHARQPCNQKSCDDPVPCILSDWSAWEGSGHLRFRKPSTQGVFHPNGQQRSHKKQIRPRCNRHSPYQKFRFRDVLQTEMNGGKACDVSLNQTAVCLVVRLFSGQRTDCAWYLEEFHRKTASSFRFMRDSEILRQISQMKVSWGRVEANVSGDLCQS